MPHLMHEHREQIDLVMRNFSKTERPAMVGGIVALLNYIPYFGPVVAALLLAVGGLMTFSDVWTALAAPAIMYGAHLIEANVVTPMIVGHRLTINPVMILVSISFWGWVWGTTGAVLAVPLLILYEVSIFSCRIVEKKKAEGYF